MNCVIVLSSITYAIKAQKLLAAGGIRAELTKTSAVKAVRGCGHGIRIKCELVDKSVEIMDNAGIKLLGMLNE